MHSLGIFQALSGMLEICVEQLNDSIAPLSPHSRHLRLDVLPAVLGHLYASDMSIPIV